MITNTNAAQVANNLIAVAEDQAFEAWYKQDCLVGGLNARIAARAAWNARAALTTAAAVPPEGVVMVPVELANRVQESLGEFLMDHGWSQRDMDTSDDFGAVLLAADPKAEPVPAGEYPPLPGASLWRDETGIRGYGTDPGTGPWYTADQMRAYVDADRAMRASRGQAPAPAAVAGPSEAPEGWRNKFAEAVYADLEAADNQDVPLEEYPARILKALDSIVGPRHPTVIHWRNDAIQACIAIAYKYCRDPESFQYLKQDLQALIFAAPKVAPVAQGDGAEPVAYLWQHSETGRTRVVMPDAVITADASWRVIGPLFLDARLELARLRSERRKDFS